MKKISTILIAALICSSVFSQPKKPTIMVVPSDQWCAQNGYVSTFDNQGVQEEIPDYAKALISNPDLQLAIGKINTLMADRGFPLKNLESVMKSIKEQNAEDNLIQSKTSGASLAENPIDRFRRTARADIIMQLNWSINSTGPKRSLSYNLQGLDSYTNKQIAGAQGTGAASFSADIPVLLEEAVMANMDKFCSQLQMYFDDLQENGREVSVMIRVFDNGSGLDLETEYGGKELSEIIDAWMAENTVNHVYSRSEGSETFIKFEQVRIPLYRENGNAMDTESFVRSLRNYLRKTYEIQSKVLPRGLGYCILALGEK